MHQLRGAPFYRDTGMCQMAALILVQEKVTFQCEFLLAINYTLSSFFNNSVYLTVIKNDTFLCLHCKPDSQVPCAVFQSNEALEVVSLYV